MQRVQVGLVLFSGLGAVIMVAADKCRESFECDDTFCNSCEIRPTCEAPEETCDDGEFLHLYENPQDFCKCCPPRCIKHLKQGDECRPEISNRVPSEMCGPRLACILSDDENVYQCQPTKSKCMLEAAQVLLNPGMNQRPPECDNSGFYEPKQCTETNGLCRCVDKLTGIPIVSGGLEAGVIEAMESGMDCQCARSYHETLQQGCDLSVAFSDFIDDLPAYQRAIDDCVALANNEASPFSDNYFGDFGHMRCQPNGNYDPIQCVTKSYGDTMCFCINSTTVQLDSEAQQQFAMVQNVETLSCFNSSNSFHNSDHFRPCEAKVKEIKDLEDLVTGRGSGMDVYLHTERPPICSNDGFFAKVQINASDVNAKFCSDPFGSRIEDFVASVKDVRGRKMNCECAIARHHLTTNDPKCCGNGNYLGRQCNQGLCYCVDEYGRQQETEVEQIDAGSLDCSDFCCESDSYEEGDFCYES